MGYAAHLDFVDDNLIGNKKSLRLFFRLRRLAAHARLSVRVFDRSLGHLARYDPKPQEMMAAANFFGVFVGIESPDPATLVAMKKKQNTGAISREHSKDIRPGMLVTVGLIGRASTARQARSRMP